MTRRKLLTMTAAAALAAGVGVGQAKADLSDGLVAHYPFDEGSGTTAGDASGNGNDGTIDGASFSADTPVTFGNAFSLDFDGTNDIVATDPGDEGNFDLTDLSLSLWFKLEGESGDNNFPRVVSKGNSTTSNGSYSVWVKDASDPTDIGLRILDADDQRLDTRSSSVPDYDDGEWHHVAVTYDEDGGGCTGELHVDGALLQTENFGAACVPRDVGNVFSIGAVADAAGDALANGRFFNGKIDEVRVYDRVLTSDEIALLASGAPESDPFADAVESFTPPTGCKLESGDPVVNDCNISGDDGDGGADALEEDDGDAGDNTTFTSLGYTTDVDGDAGDGLQPEGGELVLNFTDNICTDDAGDDLTVFEVAGVDETYAVAIGLQGLGLTALSVDGTGTTGFDAEGVSPFDQTAITALEGTFTNPTGGPDIDAVECLNAQAFGTDFIEKTLTGDSEVDIGSVDTQQFSFRITFWNSTGSPGLPFNDWEDTVPAEFDLDEVDGTAIDPAEGDDLFPVGDPDNDGCSVSTHRTKNWDKGKDKLEPEFIEIDTSSLPDGSSCTVDVTVTTDANPGGGSSPAFEPTACPTSGLIPLNDGVRAVDQNGNVLFFDDDQLFLTCTP